MREQAVISLRDVSKVYRLYGSQREQLLDILGLRWRGFGRQRPVREFSALKDISLDVARGQRLGIVGRNGAGKTTLLKVICGIVGPTSGTVEVNGTVQALLSMGLGFHPDYTGRENVESALQYNGLSRKEYKEAVNDIVEFCELGQFIDQPFKIYSLGMQGRLMFATSTAVHPEILIVDEVLSAGDAYFVAKSRLRVEKLIKSGSTMLLVSHSMHQILDFCDEAVWIDDGAIRMRGDAFGVVKAYEGYLHGPIQRMSAASPESLRADVPGAPARVRENGESTSARDGRGAADEVEPARRPLLQDPPFRPHAEVPDLEEVPDADSGTMRFEAPGGLSRWAGEVGLKITGFSIVTPKGVSNTLVPMQPAKIVFFLVGEADGHFKCRYGLAIHDLKGQWITGIWGPPDEFSIRSGGIRRVEVLLNPNQLGPGEYTVGITVLECTPLEVVNSARRYDLLSRSFLIKVELPASLAAVASAFLHSAEWQFQSVT